MKITSPISIFREVERGGQRIYQVDHPQAYGERRVAFPVEKPPGRLRVFSLGGSASAGWPHPKREIYSAYLERALRAALPGQDLEVLNVGAHGFASYRIRRVFEDVLAFEPDLMILYSGNNEFFEARSYSAPSPLARLASRSRLASSLRGWMEPIDSVSGRGRTRAATRDFLVSMLDRRPHPLRSDPDQFEQVIEHYAFSIEAMLRAADEAGVPTLLLTVPVNLRDWRPNVSASGLAGPPHTTWRAIYDDGMRLSRMGQDAEAEARLREALDLAPEYAETHFELARLLERQGRDGEAQTAYRAACDLDFSPWRALSRMNDVLRSLARSHPNTHLVDLDRAFLEAASRGLPGFDLFLDYVHPTKPGNRLIARLVFDAIRDAHLLGVPDSAAYRHVDVRRPRDGRVFGARDDLRLRGKLLWFFLAMHQYETVVDVTTRLLAGEEPLSGEDRERYANLRTHTRAHLVNRERLLLGQPVDPGHAERHRRFMRNAFDDVYDPARADDQSLDR